MRIDTQCFVECRGTCIVRRVATRSSFQRVLPELLLPVLLLSSTVAQPIVLDNPVKSTAYDDSGTAVVSTTLIPPSRHRALYEDFDPLAPRTFTRVPSLATFCIRALAEACEQLHILGSRRLPFPKAKRKRKDAEASDESRSGREKSNNGFLRAIVRDWGASDFSLCSIDPRLWATLVQIYSDPPDDLRVYPVRLCDAYLPLLNQIPATSDFTLVTTLDLQGSKNITDSNIINIKILHSLCALDMGKTGVSSRAIEILSRALLLDNGQRRGTWRLRILRLRGCHRVDKSIFPFLSRFPHLCVVGESSNYSALLSIDRKSRPPRH